MQITTIPNQATAIAALAVAVTSLRNDVTALQADDAALQAVAAAGAIYDPAATPALNVFNVLGDAIAALNVFGGGTCVIRDGGDSNAAHTNVGTFNIDGIRFVGQTYQTPTLNVVEGTVFTTPLTNQFDANNVAFKWAGASAPFTVANGSNLGVSLENYASITATPDSTGPFFGVAGNLYMDVGRRCALSTNSGGFPLVDMSATGTTEIQMGVASTLSADTITGGADQALLVTNETAGLTAGGGNANVNETQTGTINPQFVPA